MTDEMITPYEAGVLQSIHMAQLDAIKNGGGYVIKDLFSARAIFPEPRKLKWEEGSIFPKPRESLAHEHYF